MRVILTHSLFVQEFLRKGRGNSEYLRLRAELSSQDQESLKGGFSKRRSADHVQGTRTLHEYYDGDDFVLYDPWLRSGASATGQASVMEQDLQSTGRQLEELLKEREAILEKRLNHQRLVRKGREMHARAHLNLPQQQLQEAPPYPALALPLSMSVTHMRDTLKPLDAERPREARCEASSADEPLPVAPSTAAPELSAELGASVVSVQVRSARQAEANFNKSVRPWSLPNGSLSVAAVSILGSESKTFKPPPAQVSSKFAKESDSYFFHAATQHIKALQSKQPTTNHEVWDQTRERLQQAVRDNRAKHEASMDLLKRRSQRTQDELKALKIAHNKLKESSNQMRESAFEVMTLRAQSDEANEKAVQRMNALRG